MADSSEDVKKAPPATRDHRGRWIKGAPSPNPRGKAAGAKDWRAKLALELKDDAPAATKRIREMLDSDDADRADRAALWVADRLLPRHGEYPPVPIDLGDISDRAGVQRAREMISKAAAAQEISYTDAERIERLLARVDEGRSAMVVDELKLRIDALDAAAADRNRAMLSLRNDILQQWAASDERRQMPGYDESRDPD